jgi:hypothetical protein
VTHCTDDPTETADSDRGDGDRRSTAALPVADNGDSDVERYGIW